VTDVLQTLTFGLCDNVKAIVHEHTGHPARYNRNLHGLFCADGWWRAECWYNKDGSPSLFATTIVIRVFDEKHHCTFIRRSNRFGILCIPPEGNFHDVHLIESEDAVAIRYQPNDEARLGFLALKIPEHKNT
jgi:hypothetical protein